VTLTLWLSAQSNSFIVSYFQRLKKENMFSINNTHYLCDKKILKNINIMFRIFCCLMPSLELEVRVVVVHFFFFFCRRYSPWWTSASFMIACHWSWSCDFRLQFLMPIVFRSSSTESSHLIAGLPTRWVPSGLCRVNFLQGFCSCILKKCPSHHNHPTLIIWFLYFNQNSPASKLGIHSS
jgi:hypothetical protein